jgi:hypothetical protein
MTPFKELIEQQRTSTGPLAKGELRFRFIDRLMTAKDLGNVIGGFPISVLATPAKHAYLYHAGFYTFDLPAVRPGETVEQSIEDVYTGRNHVMMSVIPSRQSDVPVVGACLLQALTGWVYSPIEDRTPFKVQLAPAGTEWEGRERDMYDKLLAAIEAHVGAVAFVPPNAPQPMKEILPSASTREPLASNRFRRGKRV